MGRAILVFLIPAIISFAGVMHITSSKQPEIVHLAAAYGPGTGYEKVPEQYTITASPSYKWHHGTRKTWLVIIGVLLFAASGAYVYWVDREVKIGTWKWLAIFWLGGLLCIFGKHSFRYYESKTYSRTISAEQYEANKNNLDAIFQQ